MIVEFKSYVLVKGSRVFINSDTMTCFKVIELLSDADPEKLGEAMALFFKEEPAFTDFELEAMTDFLYKSMNDFESESGKKVVDLIKDFDAIWSGIYRVFKVDITENLHWWKFLLMLSDLSSEPALVGRIRIRSTNLNEIKDTKARNEIAKEQNRLRLEKKLSLAERNRKWLGG